MNTPWVVQDVFSGGIPGPGFTVHETEAEALEEAERRGSTAAPYQPKTCGVCGDWIGVDRRPLQGGCVWCR